VCATCRLSIVFARVIFMKAGRLLEVCVGSISYRSGGDRKIAVGRCQACVRGGRFVAEAFKQQLVPQVAGKIIAF
jgi:hypothetical protein